MSFVLQAFAETDKPELSLRELLAYVREHSTKKINYLSLQKSLYRNCIAAKYLCRGSALGLYRLIERDEIEYEPWSEYYGEEGMD